MPLSALWAFEEMDKDWVSEGIPPCLSKGNGMTRSIGCDPRDQSSQTDVMADSGEFGFRQGQ